MQFLEQALQCNLYFYFIFGNMYFCRELSKRIFLFFEQFVMIFLLVDCSMYANLFRSLVDT